MDFYHYINIFDTKGIEYILVIAFMVSMLLFIKVLSRSPRTMPVKLSKVQERQVMASDQVHEDAFGISSGYFISQGHLCSRLCDDGTLAVGAGRLAEYMIGNVTEIDLVKPGLVKSGDPLAVISDGSRSVTLLVPSDGEVQQVNEDLVGNPGALAGADDPDRWLARFAPKDLQGTLSSMHFADQARRWLDQEVVRMRDLLSSLEADRSGGTMALADGGLPARGMARELSENDWGKFHESFFGLGR